MAVSDCLLKRYYKVYLAISTIYALFQLPHDRLRLRHLSHQIKQPIDSCPIHPEPVPLPSPLPKDIANAISTLEQYLAEAVDKTAVVSRNNDI